MAKHIILHHHRTWMEICHSPPSEKSLLGTYRGFSQEVRNSEAKLADPFKVRQSYCSLQLGGFHVASLGWVYTDSVLSVAIRDLGEKEEDVIFLTAYRVFGTSTANACTDSQTLMNITAATKYWLTPTNLHFHLHVTEICAEILGLFELQTQSETCG